MNRQTPAAQPHIDALAQRYPFGEMAIAHLLAAVADGQTQMAEFDHPDFGGPGMWMAGGMLMLSRPNDHQLKAEVEALCEELGALLRAEPGLVDNTSIRHSSVAAVSQSQTQRSGVPGPVHGQPSMAAASSDWPAALGTPNVTGSQNDLRYAWSAETARLAIDDGRAITLYDTGDHWISGISQQQGGQHANLTLTSQHGTVVLSDLHKIETTPASADQPPSASASATSRQAPASSSSTQPSPAQDHDALFTAIERLGDLRARELITEDEFSAKKAELLARL